MSETVRRFMRLPEVIEISGYARSSIYALMARGEFPKPVKLGSKAVAWVEDEVLAWQTQRIAARDAR